MKGPWGTPMRRPDGWTFHNLVGHVVSEITYLLGAPASVYKRVHDDTAPASGGHE